MILNGRNENGQIVGETVVISKDSNPRMLDIFADVANIQTLRHFDIKIIDKGENESATVLTSSAGDTRDYINNCLVIAIANPFIHVSDAAGSNWSIGNDAASKKLFYDFIRSQQPGQTDQTTDENLVKNKLNLLI